MYLFYPFITARKPESDGYLLTQLENFQHHVLLPHLLLHASTVLLREKKKHSKISYQSMEISNSHIDFHRLVKRRRHNHTDSVQSNIIGSEGHRVHLFSYQLFCFWIEETLARVRKAHFI